MKSLLGAAAIALALTACAKSGGNEFVGRWTNVKHPVVMLQIEKNGQSYMVRHTRPSFLTGQLETSNVPATYKDGQLLIVTEGGGRAFAIDAKTGKLTDGKFDYEKAP